MRKLWPSASFPHARVCRCALLACALVLDACHAPPSPQSVEPTNPPGLHNVVTYVPGLISGGAPQGDDAFDTLRSWGVVTIISVDGATPDVERAAAHGIRYVHLPMGYNGLDATQRLELARAVRDLPGPIYIHCHHGKHRSAGAAAAAAVTLGRIQTSGAIARMHVSGTAPEYQGLFACVSAATVATAQELDSAPNEFPQVHVASTLVQAMVHIDELVDQLKEVEKAGWQVPAQHADLVPPAIAGLLADHLRVLCEQECAGTRTDQFMELLTASTAAAQHLEGRVVDGNSTQQQRSAALKSLVASCKDCHVKYRN